jgi:hypothetical protein
MGRYAGVYRGSYFVSIGRYLFIDIEYFIFVAPIERWRQCYPFEDKKGVAHAL